MTVCAGITRGGERCTQSVKTGFIYCHHHDPARAEARRRTASRAGRTKTPRMVRELHELLDTTTQRVLDGELKPYPGMVAGQLIGVKIRLLEFERQLRETEEFELRLQQLEEAADRSANTHKNGRRAHAWG